MDRVGSNLFYNVQNYMAESVMLGGNLRVQPSPIKSLRRDDTRPRNDVNNGVLITIYRTENEVTSDLKKRLVHTRKTEIRVPGKMLNQGSVFIAELDCYLMTESQMDATRQLIVNDTLHADDDAILLPSSMAKQSPAVTYEDKKELTQFCLQRQDKISIRIGIDLRYDNLPEIIKTMHISILDSYFIPYTCYKLVYDPTLDPDEFVIENLYIASREEFRSTFTHLDHVGVIYLDHNETETLFGRFYGLGIFSNEKQYLAYVHERKSQERFEDESLYLATLSGDPLLKEEINKLSMKVNDLTQTKQELENDNKSLRQLNTNLKADVKNRNDTIERIRSHQDSQMSSDAVLEQLANERIQLKNEAEKLAFEREDLAMREKSLPLQHKANRLKSIADIVKSGWGILTASIGALIALLALAKKYNIKLVMG